MAALEPTSASEELNAVVRSLRSGTWAPPAYLLPLGAALVLWWKPTPHTSKLCSRLSRSRRPPACLRCSSRCRVIPSRGCSASFARHSCGTAAVDSRRHHVWRRRHGDRIAHALAYYALALALAHSLMLYSDEATSKFAMTAHFGVFAGGLFLLLSLVQMGTADTARRMRDEQVLQSINEALEVRVAARTAELQSLNADLRREVNVREAAEDRRRPAARIAAPGLRRSAPHAGSGARTRAAARARPDGERHRARHQQCDFAGRGLCRNAADARNRLQSARPRATRDHPARGRRRRPHGGAHG